MIKPKEKYEMKNNKITLKTKSTKKYTKKIDKKIIGKAEIRRVK